MYSQVFIAPSLECYFKVTKNGVNRFVIRFGGTKFRLWMVKVMVKKSLHRPAHQGGKVVSPTHRPPLPPGYIPEMKNSNDIIGNRTRDLPACSAGSNLGLRKPIIVTTLPVNWDFCFWDLQKSWCRHNWTRSEFLASFAANHGASSFCLSITDFWIKQTKHRRYLSKLYNVQSQLLVTYQLLRKSP